jgi:hypothetical protein
MSGDSWNDDEELPPSVSTDVHIKLNDDLAAVKRCTAIFEPHDCMMCWRERIPTVKHGNEFMWDIQYLVSNDCLEAVCRKLTAAGFKYDTCPYDPRELEQLRRGLCSDVIKRALDVNGANKQ